MEFMNNFRFLKLSQKRAIVVLALLVSVAIIAVGGTVAYMIVVGGYSINTFTPAQTGVTISGEVIENQSEIPVYARAAVVLTWVSEDGSVTLSEKPTEGNYVIVYNTAEGWFRGSDGYWYYESSLGTAESATRAPKLLTVSSVTDAPEGYVLSVEILTSVIQANPPEAVRTSWTAVDLDDNGLLIAK